MRGWGALLAAAAMTACGGKVYLDVPGAGGAGGSGAGGSGSATPDTGSSSVDSGGGTAGGDPGCVRCGEFLADPTLGTGHFCPDSQPIYDAMHGCICETTCAALCAANVCKGFSIDVPCNKCIEDMSTGGCGVQYAACGSNL